jgi:uncharacterized protein (UPF0548 family)
VHELSYEGAGLTEPNSETWSMPEGLRRFERTICIGHVDRCGLAYGTLRGHPASGEEAFIMHRDAAGAVSLTVRSLTRPALDGIWRPAFPVLLLAQRFFRRRYLRALAPSLW